MKSRKPTRWNHYAYSQDGMYFVTICTKDREELFGQIKDGKMVLNELGKIAKKCLLEIPNHFQDVFLDEYVIMPNHIHCIIEIIDNPVGNAHVRSANNPDRSKMLLPKIIQGFKAAVTKICNRTERACAFPTIWQKSFYDHIIRDEKSLNKIREYIEINPAMWDRDRNNTENIFM